MINETLGWEDIVGSRAEKSNFLRSCNKYIPAPTGSKLQDNSLEVEPPILTCENGSIIGNMQ